MSYVLEISNVRFKYEMSSHWVLKGVELRVGSGELVLIFGGNGVGKTTLLKLIAGLLKPQEGLIKVMGKKLNGVAPTTIGYSLQNPIHNPSQEYQYRS